MDSPEVAQINLVRAMGALDLSKLEVSPISSISSLSSLSSISSLSSKCSLEDAPPPYENDLIFESFPDLVKTAPEEAWQTALGHMENYLQKGSEVVDCHYLTGGVNGGFVFTYKNGVKAVFKTSFSDEENYSLFEHEIGAYQLAKHFGIRRIPPTPSMVFDTRGIFFPRCPYMSTLGMERGPKLLGSIQYFVPDSVDGLDMYDFRTYDKKKSKELLFFDFLTFNCDRPGSKNMIFYGDEPFYIDNGMAFLKLEHLLEIRKKKEYSNYCQIMIPAIQAMAFAGKDNPGALKPLCRFLPEDKTQLWKLKGINKAVLDDILGKWVSGTRISDILVRRDALVRAISVCQDQ